MIEILKNNESLMISQTALLANRYKKKGCVIIGIGYPFFYYEFFGLIKLCDWFIDDNSSYENTGWSKYFNIKDYRDIDYTQKYIGLLFSLNRLSILDKIKESISYLEIISIYNKISIIKILLSNIYF